MKLNKVLLNIVSVFCFLFGAFYVFSLVFIPVGIYCFTAGRRFSYKADHLMDNYSLDQKTMRNYSIFVSIACFPFGLLALIVYLRVYSNNIKVETSQTIKVENVEGEEETLNNKTSVNENVEEGGEETEEEKLEKLEKLRNFKEKGIITEEEFKMAKEQMFGDKKVKF